MKEASNFETIPLKIEPLPISGLKIDHHHWSPAWKIQSLKVESFIDPKEIVHLMKSPIHSS